MENRCVSNGQGKETVKKPIFEYNCIDGSGNPSGCWVCPECNQPEYGEKYCPFCGQRLGD